VYLTWEPVIDAHGYEIYRQDLSVPSSNPVYLNTVEGTDTAYADVVSASNQIKSWSDTVETANEYRYTIVALSEKSTAGRSALDVLQNGKSEVTVRPYIPEAAAALTVAPISAVTILEPYTTDDNESEVVATWVSNNLNPGIKYDVEWVFFETDGNRSTGKKGNLSGWVKSYPIPFSGNGTLTVNVSARFGDGTYYTTSIVQTKASAPTFFDVSGGSLPTVSPPNVTRTDSSDQVVVSFNAIYGVDDIAKYKLEKAEFIGNDATNIRLGDWTDVPLTPAVPIGTGTGTGTWGWEITNTIATNKSFVYRLKVTAEGQTLVSQPSSNTGLVGVSVTGLAVTQYQTGAASYVAAIEWDRPVETGVTYEVWRAKAESSDGITWINAEPYTKIAGITPTQTGNKLRVTNATLLYRQEYIYRVVAIKNNIRRQSTKSLITGVYSSTIGVNASDTSTAGYATTTATALTSYYRLNGLADGGLLAGESYVVYGIPSSNSNYPATADRTVTVQTTIYIDSGFGGGRSPSSSWYFTEVSNASIYRVYLKTSDGRLLD
jgi:hypothetical protein